MVLRVTVDGFVHCAELRRLQMSSGLLKKRARKTRPARISGTKPTDSYVEKHFFSRLVLDHLQVFFGLLSS